jgi:DNA-binding transcriptional MerR regulator
MEHLTTGILRRSSDAVVIIGPGERVLDVNEAFFTATGHARHELVGRQGQDLLVGFERAAGRKAGTLERPGTTTGAPIGLWTRSGELRVGDLSALELQVEDEQTVLCTIRGLRDPTPRQRRAVAQEELHRVLRRGARSPETAIRSLQAFGSCLRWDFGALWRGRPRTGSLRCVAVWRAPQSDLERLEDATRDATTYPPGMESLHRSWTKGEPTWIPDASANAGIMRRHGGVGEPVHAWLAFPALGPDGVVGVAEFVSREIRQPDTEFLGTVEDYGRLFGQVIQDTGAADGRPLDAATVPHAPPERWPGTAPAAFRNLAGAVAAAAATLQRPDAANEIEPPALLGELTASIDKLNRLLEGAAERGAPTPGVEPSAPPAQPPAKLLQGLPTGLTLKAVSRRTGIPAATLRTWEHRYRFMRPRRSSTGYRLYGEDEIARIEQVKYLVGQGVRVGAAMQAVIEQAEASPDEGQQDTQQSGQPDHGREAEVYRLAFPDPARSPASAVREASTTASWPSDPGDDVRHRAAADRDRPA